MPLTPRSYPAPHIDAFACASDATGETYDVIVGLPHTYAAQPDRTYPAVIVLDGTFHFACVNTLARYLVHEIEDVIVIGVDLPAEMDYFDREKRRVRQFTPKMDWPMTDPFGEGLKGYLTNDLGDPSRVGDFLGGADAFFSFLCEDLTPTLAERYRIDRADLGLAGNSAAGFFTSTVLFRDDAPFRRYFLSSPAMAYGDGEIFRREGAWVETHNDLDASIVMAAGELEIDNIYYEGRGQIVSGMMRLAGLLTTRNYPNLDLSCHVLEGVGHIDSLYPTLARGMRRFYAREHPFTAI